MADDEHPKKFWKSPVFFLPVGITLLVAARGYFIARMIGGRYSMGSLLFDAAAAMVILVVLQLSDSLLTKTLARCIGEQTRPRRVLAKATRLLVVGLCFGTFLLATVQMHPPKVSCQISPTDEGIPFTEHTIPTSDGLALSAWVIPCEQANRPVIVITHGLGSNKQNFMHIGKLFYQLNYNVVMFDFRAHGNSQGHTCTLGVREANDVKAAFDLAQSQFPGQPIFGWSTSMGGAATLRAAAEFQIFDKLVVDATFSSVKNVAMDTKFCYLGPFDKVAWNMSRIWFATYSGVDINAYGPIHDIPKIVGKPIMLIHGTIDSILPTAESQKLHAAAKGNTQLWIVAGASHCGSFLHPDYTHNVSTFLEQSPSPAPATLSWSKRRR